MASLSNPMAYPPPWAAPPQPAATSQAPVVAPTAAAPTAPAQAAPTAQAPVDPAQQAFQRNSAWLKPGENSYNTQLDPSQELAFRAWVQKNKVPFDFQQKLNDYDMRGFYKAMASGDPRAKNAVNPNDGRLHYPDYWKTPYHNSFSNESQWADPAKAPSWNEKDQLVLPDGTVVFDERAQKGAQ
jgi:hypothetical protein